MEQDSLLIDSTIQSGAEFSQCRTYRYVLWRRWGWYEHAKQVMFIGLNPSTADETKDDPTIRRCIRFAKDWGFNGLLMMNAFAFRATDPKVMRAAADPVGPANDEAIGCWKSQVGKVIAAWGNQCGEERAKQVCRVIGTPLYCLARNKSGAPKHPLYTAADTMPNVFWSPS